MISLHHPGLHTIPDFYKGTVVVAYKRPAVDGPWRNCSRKSPPAAAPQILRMLSDGELEKTTKLPIPAARRNLVDSIRILAAAGDSRRHICDQGPRLHRRD